MLSVDLSFVILKLQVSHLLGWQHDNKNISSILAHRNNSPKWIGRRAIVSCNESAPGAWTLDGPCNSVSSTKVSQGLNRLPFGFCPYSISNHFFPTRTECWLWVWRKYAKELKLQRKLLYTKLICLMCPACLSPAPLGNWHAEKYELQTCYCGYYLCSPFHILMWLCEPLFQDCMRASTQRQSMRQLFGLGSILMLRVQSDAYSFLTGMRPSAQGL